MMITDRSTNKRLCLQLSQAGRLFRALSFASVAGVGYALWGAMTAEGMGPLLYVFFWLPVYAGNAVVLFIASCNMVEPRLKRTDRRLRLLVEILVAAIVIGLLGEGIAIWFERKYIQTIELFVLALGLVAFRVRMHSAAARLQYDVNVLTVGALSAISVCWFPILRLVLFVFDKG